MLKRFCHINLTWLRITLGNRITSNDNPEMDVIIPLSGQTTPEQPQKNCRQCTDAPVAVSRNTRKAVCPNCGRTLIEKS